MARPPVFPISPSDAGHAQVVQHKQCTDAVGLLDAFKDRFDITRGSCLEAGMRHSF
jgi:hypothetical protein